MSGKGNKGNWRCNNCSNLNFGWRIQCNRCRRSKFMGNNQKSDEGGLGVGTALLVGAGAAAVGFLAQGLWSAFQGSSSSSEPSTAPPPSSGPSADDITARKRQRDAFRDQDIPKEMKCAVCLVNPREICMLPCGHIYLCEDCADDVKTKCPMCEEPISSKKAVYL